jgi:hypothetical protein
VAINVTWLQNGGYTAPQDRTEQTAMLTKSAVVSVRSGIVPSDGTDATVTAQGTPNMTVNVSPFQAIIPDANGRAYVYTCDASVVSPAFATASGSHPRIDLVIARVYDNAAGDSAATTSLTLPGTAGSITVQSVTGTVELVTGTPAASPTAPALPNSRCVILACVTVPTSASSIVTGDIASSGGGASRAGFTVASGGTLPCASSAVYPATPYEGMPIYDMALNYNLTYDGGAWRPYGIQPLVWNHIGDIGSIYGTGAADEDATETTYFRPAFTKDALGFVTCRGLVAVTGAQASAFAILNLPAGYRPSKRHRVFTANTGATGNTINILPTGDFQFDLSTAGSVFVSLDDVRYFADI